MFLLDTFCCFHKITLEKHPEGRRVFIIFSFSGLHFRSQEPGSIVVGNAKQWVGLLMTLGAYLMAYF